MSLGILIKSPEGLVLAAESRVTMNVPVANQMPNLPGLPQQIIPITYDNATKILSFHKPYEHIGVVTYGMASIGFRTAQSFIPEFEAHLKDNANSSLSIYEFAKELKSFFTNQWNLVMPANFIGQPMIFNVAGFDDGEPYGKIFTFNIPSSNEPIEINPKVGNQHMFGINWGGQSEIVDRMVKGYDNRIFDMLAQSGIDNIKIDEMRNNATLLHLPIPIQVMALQDCVTLALLFIKTTIEIQKLSMGLRGCGGPIDVAIIRRNEPLDFVQRKKIVGEL